jgi:hypothetical protein
MEFPTKSKVYKLLIIPTQTTIPYGLNVCKRDTDQGWRASKETEI